jgi:hypothetical protein
MESKEQVLADMLKKHCGVKEANVQALVAFLLPKGIEEIEDLDGLTEA